MSADEIGCLELQPVDMVAVDVVFAFEVGRGDEPEIAALVDREPGAVLEDADRSVSRVVTEQVHVGDDIRAFDHARLDNDLVTVRHERRDVCRIRVVAIGRDQVNLPDPPCVTVPTEVRVSVPSLPAATVQCSLAKS